MGLSRAPLQHSGLLHQRKESKSAGPRLTVSGASLLSEVGASRNPTLQMGSEPKVRQLASGRARVWLQQPFSCRRSAFLSSNKRRWWLSCFSCSGGSKT